MHLPRAFSAMFQTLPMLSSYLVASLNEISNHSIQRAYYIHQKCSQQVFKYFHESLPYTFYISNRRAYCKKANLKNHFRHESYCNEFRNQQTKRKSLTDVPLVHKYSVPRDVYHAESVASMGSKNESAFHSRRSQRGRESRR